MLSDTELLESARQGDHSALTELYVRHYSAARRLASSTSGRSDPDDLANEAFEKVFAAIQRDNGPTDAFRAYLFVTIRRLAARQAARHLDEPYDEVPEPVAAARGTPPLDPTEREMVTQAFSSLPERWQAVLWHTAVEGHKPGDVASTLGMTANAVSALAYRAREKLRQAYLQAHLQAAPRPACEPHRSALGAYVRNGLGRREHSSTAAHVQRCSSCQTLVGELDNVNQLLARSVLPIFLVQTLGELPGADPAVYILGSGGPSPGPVADPAIGAERVDILDPLGVDPAGSTVTAVETVTSGRKVAGFIPEPVGLGHMVGAGVATFALLVALGTGGSMLLDQEHNPGPEVTTDEGPGQAAPPTTTTSTESDLAGEAEHDLRAFDMRGAAGCFPGSEAPADTPARDGGNGGNDNGDDGNGRDGDGDDRRDGLFALQLGLDLPVAELLDLGDDDGPATIRDVDCDTSSGDSELVVTIGADEQPAPQPDPAPEPEPEPLVEVDNAEVSLDASPVLPEIDVGLSARVDEELGISAALETNLNELCVEDDGNLVCTLDSALGGAVSGTLSEAGLDLQLDGPGGNVLTLELRDGDLLVDTRVLNLLP